MEKITTAISSKINELDFYKHFRFGMEYEMEISNLTELDLNKPTLLKFIHDGSIQQTKKDTTCIELITAMPLASQKQENQFFSDMKTVLPNFKSKNGEDIFSYYNTSAGTHYHFSFKNHDDSILSIFDCIDFEKFFFNKYMEEFKSEKFLSRINTNYCKTNNLKSAEGMNTQPYKIKRDLNKLNLVSYQQSYEGRYRWLNMQSVREGTGAEIRLFPFLQTHEGVAKVTNFMKSLLMEYYFLPSTQEKIKLIEIYNNNVVNNNFKINKLNDLKRIVYDTIMLQYLNSNSENRHITGEIQMLFAKWIIKQPSLIPKAEKAY